MPTSKKLNDVLGVMKTVPLGVYRRSERIAQRLGHGSVENTHLLLGLLALGNEDIQSPVPRGLREAGADYNTLYKFLASSTELNAQSVGVDPTASTSLVQTLSRARRLAGRRRHDPSRDYIVTRDLLRALVLSARRDPLLTRAFREMNVDTKGLLNKFPEYEARPQHLQPVN